MTHLSNNEHRQIYIRQMKNFLQLKKSIVDSKNSPTIVQTYLDSIRSSCYKLSIPDLLVDPRRSNDSSQAGWATPNNVDSNPNAEYPHNSEIRTAFIEKRDNILETLESVCKSSNSYENEQQIVSTILEKLAMLERNKDYEQPIQLIKRIIQTLPFPNSISEDTPIEGIRENSFKKRSIDEREECESSSNRKGSRSVWSDQSSRAKPTADQHSQIVNQEVESLSSQENRSTEYLEYNGIKYKSNIPMLHNHPHQSHSYSSESQESASEFDHTFRTDSQSLCSSKSSFCNLQKISEKQEDEESESMQLDKHIPASMQYVCIPEQSIELKKILYMIEGSNKKNQMNKTVLINKENLSPASMKLNKTIKANGSTHSISMKQEKSTKGKNQHIISSSRVSQASGASGDKKKTIKDIVKLLGTKYNRSVTFRS